MNDQLTRIIPLAAIIFLTIFFSPFVKAQDYEVTPNLAFPQPYVNTGNINSGYTLADAANNVSGIDWVVVLPLMLVLVAFFGLWKMASNNNEEAYENARGYQIAFHDIRNIRKEKRSRAGKQAKRRSKN
jgi:hypothetical protein